MNSIYSSFPSQKPYPLKRNEKQMSSSQQNKETNNEKMIKLTDLPASQIGSISYIKKQKTYTINNKDLMAFKTQAQIMQKNNLNNIPKLSNLTPKEREYLIITLINLYGFDEFLLTITDNKPATLISDTNDIDIADKIKDHKVIKKKLQNGLTRCYILNTKEVKKVIEDNKALFETRLNAKGKTSNEIYELLSDPNTSPLLNDNINSVSDIVGLILGYPIKSCLLFKLIYDLNISFSKKTIKQKDKNALISYLNSSDSPYKNIDKDFLDNLTNDIQNMTSNIAISSYIYKTSDILSFPFQCATFIKEPKEFMRIKNSILNCTKKIKRFRKKSLS